MRVRLVAMAALSGAAMSVSVPLFAQETARISNGSAAYEYADALMAQGQPELACVFVEEVYGLDTQDVGALSRLAGCMLLLGDPTESRGFIDRALALEPDNETLLQQARMIEVAEGLLEVEEKARQLQASEAELAAINVVPPPPARAASRAAPVVVEPVAVEPELPGPLSSGRVALSRVYDSNVSGGVYHDTITAWGLPFIVDPASKATADWATRLSADGSVIVPLDWENALEIGGGIGVTIHDAQRSYDRVGAALSASWILGTNVTGGRVRAHGELDWVGGLFEQFATGVEVSGHKQLVPGTTLVGLVDVTRRNNANRAEQGWAIRSQAGIRHVIADGLTLSANLVAERVGVESSARSYWKLGPEVMVSAALTDSLGLSLSGGVDFVGFDDGLAMFTDSRRDVRYRLGGQLELSLSDLAEGLAVQASYNFSHQQSNHDLFDNNRHVVGVGLSYRF